MRTLDFIAAPWVTPSRVTRPYSSGRSKLVPWVMPDVALTAALVTIIYLLVFFGGPSALFRDADAGWHIRAGERMLASGSLLTADPFSFSKPGEAWIAWEWGADILIAATHRMGGLNAVACLYALAIAASAWMWFRLNWAAGGNFLLACLLAAPMISTTNLHWLARPHVFSWLFLLGAVWFCESIPGRLSAGHLAAVAALTALWANVHGSFVLGPMIALIYALADWLHPFLWDDASIARTGRTRAYLLTAAAAAFGSLLNPNGWNLHRHVVAYLSDSALLDRVGEFQSFNFHAAGATQIALALLIGAAGGFAALSAHRPDRFLLAMLLSAGALRSARLLPVAALLLLPLANGSITSVLTNARLAKRMRRTLDNARDYGSSLRAIDAGMHGYVMIPLAVIMLFAITRATPAGFPADQFPVVASQAVAALPDTARIFTSDKFGGYLIYRFAGERKVFFDGRSDFYGAEFLKRYSRIVQVRPGWRREFAAWGFTHALLPIDFSLVPALETEGWTEIYRDKTAVLLDAPKS